MEERIEYYDNLLKKFNPRGVKLTSQKYMELRKEIISGSSKSLDELTLLTYCHLGELLKKDYIKKDLDSQNFEDELQDVWLIADFFSKLCQKETYKYFAQYQQSIIRSFNKKRETSRRRSKERNAYLNYEWQHEIPETQDYSTTAEGRCYVAEDCKLIRRKVLKIPNKRTQEIVIYVLQNGYSNRELKKRFELTYQRFSQIKEKYVEEIRRYAEETINK